jgi:hypothetical protein
MLMSADVAESDRSYWVSWYGFWAAWFLKRMGFNGIKPLLATSDPRVVNL